MKTTGILFFTVSIVLCSLNDLIAKYLHQASLSQIIFFKSLFGLITLMIFTKKDTFFKASKNIDKWVVLRCVSLIIANGLWYFGLMKASLSSLALSNHSIPFFIVFFSFFTRINKPSPILFVSLTIIFFGSAFPLFCQNSFTSNHMILITSCAFYALSDLLCQASVKGQNPIEITIQTSLCMTLFSSPALLLNWSPIGLFDLFLLSLIGIVSLLILFCLIKAYEIHSAARLAPLHYLEFIVAVLFEFVFFKETPDQTELIGIFVVLCGLFAQSLMKKIKIITLRKVKDGKRIPESNHL